MRDAQNIFSDITDVTLADLRDLEPSLGADNVVGDEEYV